LLGDNINMLVSVHFNLSVYVLQSVHFVHAESEYHIVSMYIFGDQVHALLTPVVCMINRIWLYKI